MRDVSGMLTALGGAVNIIDIEGCVTRVRVEVQDMAKVDVTWLRDHGALAVVHADPVVQIVVGPKADALALQLNTALAAGQGLPFATALPVD